MTKVTDKFATISTDNIRAITVIRHSDSSMLVVLYQDGERFEVTYESEKEAFDMLSLISKLM